MRMRLSVTNRDGLCLIQECLCITERPDSSGYRTDTRHKAIYPIKLMRLKLVTAFVPNHSQKYWVVMIFNLRVFDAEKKSKYRVTKVQKAEHLIPEQNKRGQCVVIGTNGMKTNLQLIRPSQSFN